MNCRYSPKPNGQSLSEKKRKRKERRKKREIDLSDMTGSKQEKEYIKAVYCHPAYLTYIQSTS